MITDSATHSQLYSKIVEDDDRGRSRCFQFLIDALGLLYYVAYSRTCMQKLAYICFLVGMIYRNRIHTPGIVFSFISQMKRRETGDEDTRQDGPGGIVIKMKTCIGV